MTSGTIFRATIGFGCAAILGACKSSTPPAKGSPSQLVLITTAALTAPANTQAPPIQISVRDNNGTGLPDETVTFLIAAGGGTLTGTTAISDANGTVVAPPWKLGKSALQQTLRATIGTVQLDVNATVQTSYQIVVRFWGSTPVSAADQAIFINAAARIKGIVTGDIENTQANNFDLSRCNVVGEPNLNETIDDVVIYASVQPIDTAGGPNGNKIAQAGPCIGFAGPTGYQTAIGVMEFDSFDFNRLRTEGVLQDVVMHEMLHVLGFGVYWDATPPAGRNILSGVGSGDPRYVGTQGRAGCIAVGGTTTCSMSVPLENLFGPASENSHWRESIFGSEMMTSFVGASNPISSLTISSLVDLGLVVNSADNDGYTIPGGSFKANTNIIAATAKPGWEQVIQPTLAFERDGSVRRLRPRQ